MSELSIERGREEVALWFCCLLRKNVERMKRVNSLDAGYRIQDAGYGIQD